MPDWLATSRAHAQWPLKRALDRAGLLDPARRLIGRAPRSRLGVRVSRAADMVFLKRSAGGVLSAPLRLSAAVSPESPAVAQAAGAATKAVLCGGWGYGNLGDEAILAGYLLDGPRHAVEWEVASVAPAVTRRSLAGLPVPRGFRVLDESLTPFPNRFRQAPLVLGGGGYLNGTWSAEILGKLARLGVAARGRRVIAHAVELHELAGAETESRAAKLLGSARCSVRGVESMAEAAQLGNVEATVVADAISLLFPHVEGIAAEIDAVAGRPLVNLIDVPARSDAVEAEFPIDEWRERCLELVAGEGPDVLGLAMDIDDASFMVVELGMEVVLPTSVRGLVATLASASQLVTTRMHPALIATMLRTQTTVLPYTSKVRPTLAQLGLGEVVAEPGYWGSSDRSGRTDFSTEWEASYAASARWLYEAIREPA